MSQQILASATMLRRETLDELSAILREEFNQDLPPDEVFEVAQQLVGFFDLLLKLDAKDNNDHETTGLHKTA